MELPVPASENVGAVPGEASVQGGAAAYSIPIEVPPGRQGMQPAVRLDYESRAGNGIAGVGWSLVAGSSIYRCPRTVAQDGGTRSVDFSHYDRLCLDGERLVLVSGGYGQVGSEYRTEIDQFARITLLGGTTMSRASYFRVETRSGIIQYYGAGATRDAVYSPAGAPAPLAWKLRRSQDRQGNSMHYDYGSSATGHVLREIRYTGMGTSPGNRRVTFAYEEGRPDVSHRYRAGARLVSPLRLTDIRTYVGTELVRRYQLRYVQSEATGRSLLERIRVCANEACTGTDVTRWTSLVYASRRIGVDAHALDEASGETRQVRLVNDYDGDGTRDRLVLEYPQPWGGSPSRQLLYLSSRQAPIDLSDGPWLDAYDSPLDGYPSSRDTDFDRDGIADLVGRINGRLAIASWRGDRLVHTASNLALPGSSHVAEAIDMDADGDTDVLVLEGAAVIMHHNCTARGSQTIQFCGSTPITTLGREDIMQIADLDGNAMPDLYIDWNGLGEPVPPRIVFTSRIGSSLVFTSATVASLGGPGISLRELQGAGFFDANGDGLLDLYLLPDRLWLNTGGRFAAVDAPADSISLHHHLYTAVFPMDIDADGHDELMVPAELVHAWCYLVDSDVEPREYCGADFLRGNAPAELDRSIYRWDAVRVRFDASGAARFERSPTPLTVPLRASRVEDFYGDGLPDVSYRIADLYGATPVGMLALGSYSPPLPTGGYVARNRGAGTSASQVPDLLLMVRDGMGRAHTWSYAPLSSSGVSACPAPATSPFYRAHREAAAPHQYHFTSSMQVVARFTEPSGAGGSNTTCYRYEDAIYNDEGRGFMGFRAIIAEQANRTDPSNSLRTTTRYHDAFPRTGRVLHVQIQLAGDPASRTPLRESSQSWIPRCSGGVCFVYLAGQIERVFDLETRALLSTTTTITAYDPDDRRYGNPSAIEVTTDDAFMTHVQRTTFEYDYRSVSAWWLDKVTRTTVTDQPVHYKSAPLPDAADNAAKTVVTTFRWYGARHPSERLLAAQAVQPGSSSQELRTEYEYDAHGNLTKQRISGAGLAAPRITRWTYASDGYFATTETNAAIHTTIMDHAAATGLVLWERSRGIITRNAYDGFGRLITTTQDGTPPIHVRRLWCDASCPPWARVRVATVQNGAPIQWHYMDELERAVKTQATGFGASVARVRDIVSIAKYDKRGHLVRESQPSEDPGGAYFTTYGQYDALGRPGRKDVDRSGLPHGVFTTRYHHAGATTQITLPGGLTAARTFDARGLLVETVDTGGHATRYRHDAHGNTILIEDSAGNRLTARHDDLGRRVALSDPDGGAWSFAYNGAGELVHQTDANGESVGFVYDVLGRVRRREVNGVVESEWIYDFTHQGTLSREQNAGGYARNYTYDDALRPIRIVTQMDDLEFVQEYAYDRYYGHLEGIRYPSGEIRALDYDQFGYLVTERDPTRRDIYRVIEQMTPRGQIAREVLGNGIIGSYYHYASTGQLRHTRLMRVAGSITILQDVRYDYDDPYANLTRRTDLLTGTSEAFTYDALQRLERATRTWTDGRPDVEIGYAYDPLGNLTRKDDVALSYHYGDATRTNAANAGPHAVTSLMLPDGSQVNDFAYDGNGSMVAGSGRQVRYSAFGKPVEIREGSTTTALWYGPDQSRYKQTRGGETIYYVDKDYERIITAGGETIEKTYLGDYLVIEQTADARDVRYLHSDRMGSVDTITDAAGAVLERHGYDAFGKPLTSDWEDAGGLLHSGEYPTATTTRGFTAHEHLDAHGLIHMNGRAYDPAMGRFLSVDPYIQNPRNSQSLNPYSYVLNNPLSATDPTGYQCDPSAADTAGCIDPEGSRVPQPAAADTGSNGQQGQGVDTAANEPAVNQGKPNLPETYCGGGDGCVTVPNAARVHFQDGQVHYIFDIDESGTIRPDDGKGSLSAGGGILPIRVTLDQAKALHGAQIVLTALSGAVGAVRAALGRVFRGIGKRASHSLSSRLGGIGGMLGKLRGATTGGPKLLGTARDNLLQTAENPRLRNLINQMYRRNAKVGSGSTADAIRHELRTGELLSRSGHFVKGQEMRTAVQRLLKSGDLGAGDARIAREILTDLQKAL